MHPQSPQGGPQPNTGMSELCQALAAGQWPDGGTGIIDLLPVGVVVVSGESAETATIVHANPAMAEISGHAPEPGAPLATLGRRFYRPDRRTPLPHAELPTARAIARGETVHEVEVHVRQPDGAWRVILGSASPARVDGRIVGAVAIVQDVTALKQADTALDERAAELDAIYENAPVVMLLVDAERRVRKANRLAQQFADASEDVMLGRRGGEALRCLRALDDAEGCGFGPHCRECAVRLTVLDTLATGRNHQEVEATLPFMLDGRAQDVTFLLSTARLNVAGQPHVLVTLQDITERQRMEEHTRYLASFPEENPNPVLEVGLDGKVSYANPAALALLPGLFAAGPEHPFVTGIEALVREFDGASTRLVEREVRYGDRVFRQAVHYLPARGVLRLYCHDVTERVRAEEERSRLRRERETQRQLLESVVAHTPAGVAVLTGPEHRYALVSRSQVEIARGKGRLVGRTVAEVWPEARDHEAQRLLDQVYQTGESVHLKGVRMVLERGSGPEEAFFNLDYEPLRGEDGQVEGIILFSHEITDLVVARRNAEIMAETLEAANEQLQAQSEELQASHEELQASYEELQAQSEELQSQTEELRAQGEELREAMSHLRESEERYRGLVEMSPDAILVNRNDEIVFANPAALALFGAADAGQLLGRSPFEVFDPSYHATMRERIRRLLEGERAPLIDGRIVQVDGSVRDVEVAAAPIQDQGKPAIQVVVRDTTERKQAAEALRLSEERLRAIIDNADGIVWLKDLDGRFLVANAYLSRLLGLPQEGIVGRTVFDLFPHEIAAEYAANDREVLGAGRTVSFEERVELADGRRTYLAVKFPLLDAAGRAYAVGALCTDITERKRADLERETTVEFLRMVNESTSTAALVEAVARFLQQQSGCEAVGIRLREGDDYPYYEARGFPQEFVRLENSLCARDQAGEVKRDSSGAPILDCMCGNVICRRTDPSKPFFTAGGSFWANSTTRLLAGTTEADRQSRTCNRCNGEGYESVALVPLRMGDERIGLLQLNDRREGMFTLKDIALWERLAGYLAVAIAKLRAEESLREREGELQLIMDAAPALISYVDADLCYRRVNKAYERWFGVGAARIQGRRVPEVRGEAAWEVIRPHVERVMAGEDVTFEEEMPYAAGATRWSYHSFTPHRDESGRVVGYVVHIVDTTERKQGEEARARLAAILDATPDFVSTADVDQRVLTINRAGRRMLGLGEDEDLAGLEIKRLHPDWAYELLRTEGIPTAIRDGAWSGETALLSRDGREIPVSQVCLSHRGDGGSTGFISTIARDVSGRKQLEEELRQAQKMEAIGRLAGGVAHDFNNMLMPIMTYSQLLCGSLDPGTKAHRQAVAIAGAAERAADLPRQLLAFSRKQIIQPKVLDLNGTISGVEKMLSRLIGEDILFTVSLDPGLGKVLADPSQIDQVLLNLVVNARDAMPDGGKLTIETRNVDLDDAYTRQFVDVEPGRYVMVAVSDTGCGMDTETRSHIFEPFFTTKEQGKGTGLGLSTVYGIVKQSGGEVHVYSEPGKGTTFRVYLPRVDQPPVDADDAMQPVLPGTGSETVLVVEDANVVREVIFDILDEQGYTVIVASTGEEGLRAAESHPGAIHLLLTDVVMPGMSGPQLADRLVTERPGIRVILMSGYTEDAIVHHGVVEERIAFLQKPFTPGTLLRKVREVLDASAGS